VTSSPRRQTAARINITRQLGGNTLVRRRQRRGDRATVRKHSRRVGPQAGVRQAALVRDAVKSVRDAMIVGAILAVSSCSSSCARADHRDQPSSIPLTMGIKVWVMSLFGQNLQPNDLGAMAIAHRAVIDDAVVSENIVRHLAITPDRTIAVRESRQELIWPVTSSTITTVVVFLPLGLLTGVEGQFFPRSRSR